MRSVLCALAILVLAAPHSLQAQVDFNVKGKRVQIHGFFSQGFAYSDNNNFLTMKTSDGSGAMTDGGINISTQLTDKFRIGAQVYARNVGNLGQGKPLLDWAYADYRFASWFGVRGGRVKTAMGLFNDTQDMEFIHTFALLPQSNYPVDMREAAIAHTGGDIYGDIPLRKLGRLAYTAYAGQRQDTMHGGYIYMLRQVGLNFNEYGGLQVGQDLRWHTPLPGLMVGASHMDSFITGKGESTLVGLEGPYEEESNKDQTNAFYADFSWGNLRVNGEYRRYWRDQQIFNKAFQVVTDTRGWFTAASYRLHKRLEVGGYYSRFVPAWTQSFAVQNPDQGSPDRHIYDRVITARFDLNRYWNVKVEGHFMDGYGAVGLYPSGFYTADNPNGLNRKTNMLMLRTGFNF